MKRIGIGNVENDEVKATKLRDKDIKAEYFTRLLFV
jgi:hypothetical protein